MPQGRSGVDVLSVRCSHRWVEEPVNARQGGLFVGQDGGRRDLTCTRTRIRENKTPCTPTLLCILSRLMQATTTSYQVFKSFHKSSQIQGSGINREPCWRPAKRMAGEGGVRVQGDFLATPQGRFFWTCTPSALHLVVIDTESRLRYSDFKKLYPKCMKYRVHTKKRILPLCHK